MSIDLIWRNFVAGRNQLLLVDIIQRTTLNFLDLAIELGYLDSKNIPTENFHNALKTNDLSKLRPIFKENFPFSFGAKNILGFPYGVREKIGFQKYDQLRSEGDENTYKIERFNTFFHSANQLINIRNVNSHNQREIEDYGWSFLVAGHVMTLVEQYPGKLKEEEKLAIKTNLNSLIQEILENEKDEKDSKVENEIDQLTQINLSINDLEGKVESGLSNISQIIDKVASLSTALEASQNDKNKEIFKKEISKEAIEELLQTESMESSVPEIIKQTSETPILVTANQAERKLLALQKRIKRLFKCENWENIAQGPIRLEVLNEEISSKEDWLKNKFIKDIYMKNKRIVEDQLNSEEGKEYFEILGSIIWK